MTLASVGVELPAQRGGAKALLLTMLGEFVLPAGGAAWTSSMIAAAETLGISEKNTRQAIARIGDQGLVTSVRHGRRVRWTLTTSGRNLLEAGTRRIYEFGVPEVEWDGAWLVAHCPVAESQRPLRSQLRTRLGFLGFGEVSASLLISPHVDREPQLRQVLADLGLADDSIVLRSSTASAAEDASLVERAWDLGALAHSYGSFRGAYDHRDPVGGHASFTALVELVHDWRRFPFIDPELPTELLPANWAGATAATTFHDRHAAWTPAAQTWFADLESE